MKFKVFLIIIISIGYLIFTQNSFAENFQVVGSTESSGGSIVFKDSATKKVVINSHLDPTGRYVVSIPEGTYDISIIPLSDSGLSSVIKYNQKIDKNMVENLETPSNQFRDNTAHSKFLDIIIVLLGGFVILLGLVIGYRLFKKKR